MEIDAPLLSSGYTFFTGNSIFSSEPGVAKKMCSTAWFWFFIMPNAWLQGWITVKNHPGTVQVDLQCGLCYHNTLGLLFHRHYRFHIKRPGHPPVSCVRTCIQGEASTRCLRGGYPEHAALDILAAAFRHGSSTAACHRPFTRLCGGSTRQRSGNFANVWTLYMDMFRVNAFIQLTGFTMDRVSCGWLPWVMEVRFVCFKGRVLIAIF